MDVLQHPAANADDAKYTSLQSRGPPRRQTAALRCRHCQEPMLQNLPAATNYRVCLSSTHMNQIAPRYSPDLPHQRPRLRPEPSEPHPPPEAPIQSHLEQHIAIP